MIEILPLTNPSLYGSLISPGEVKPQDSVKTHENPETLHISWKSQPHPIL